MKKQPKTMWVWRRRVVLSLFMLATLALLFRAVQLQVFKHDFYLKQGTSRQQRTVAIPAHRGNILDRHGAPIAVSTPIDSVWGVPEEMLADLAKVRLLANGLGLDQAKLVSRVELAASQKREFLYVQRHVRPDTANEIRALKVPGVSTMREYRRYYPSGRAASHVVGFTDVDDRGREGMEMAYDGWLRGSYGKRRVVRDLKGREIEGLSIVKPAVSGKDLNLSIDKQLQYFADRALMQAIEDHKAESASIVVLDVRSGEVMAMANYPSYNPNNTAMRTGGKQRNRAITDVFEPGSTMKPFTIAAALESGQFAAEDIIFTSPGHYKIGKYEVRDEGDYGWLDLRGIIRKSSNVGVSKVASQLEPEHMWSVFDQFGFGRPTGSAFPGEVAGYFNHPTLWHHVEQVTLSYGYGISVSALQLVRAYAAIANGGKLPQISFVKSEDEAPGEQVISAAVASELRVMLEGAVSDQGTGRRARIPGYRVAGKTGTSHRSQSGGYAEDRYVSVFAGFAPVSDPRFAAVVVVHDPTAGQHFGGVVAAPIFSSVMGSALRLSGTEPDDIKLDEKQALLQAGDGGDS